MPYADPEIQRAYNRKWRREHPNYWAYGPLAREIEECVRRLGPVGPSAIVAEIGRSNVNAVGVQLHRLRYAGRVKRLGYGKWVIA